MTDVPKAPSISWVTGNPLPPESPEESREKIHKLEDRLLKAVDQHTSDAPSPPPQEAQDIPVDAAAEKNAFTAFLKTLNETPEDDTTFIALSVDEFAAESFTPPIPDSQDQ